MTPVMPEYNDVWPKGNYIDIWPIKADSMTQVMPRPIKADSMTQVMPRPIKADSMTQVMPR